MHFAVIASETKQSRTSKEGWIASSQNAPRNDELGRCWKPLDVIASEAKQSSDTHAGWIA
jgi:hypothetical protein